MSDENNSILKGLCITLVATFILACGACAPLTRSEETQYAKLLNERGNLRADPA